MSYNKVKRTEKAHYLNTTPITEDNKEYLFKLIGVGITDFGIDYNPQKENEKWIINDNTTTENEGYQLSGGVEQTAYKGDPVFDYVENIAYNLDLNDKAKTQILEVYKYRYTKEEGGAIKYQARIFDCLISITSTDGDKAKINYDIDINGDPILGTVTFVEGAPVFTATI